MSRPQLPHALVVAIAIAAASLAAVVRAAAPAANTPNTPPATAPVTTHPTTGPATAPAPFTGKRSQWAGFDRYDFECDGRPAVVVAPKDAAPGRPWLWRGEFFGAFPSVDQALLAKG